MAHKQPLPVRIRRLEDKYWAIRRNLDREYERKHKRLYDKYMGELDAALSRSSSAL